MSKKRRIYRDDRRKDFPSYVENFADADFDSFKKENKGFFKKKEMREEFYSEMTFELQGTIDWLLRNGHIQDQNIQEMKKKCFMQFTFSEKKQEENRYAKYLTARIKDEGTKSIENIMFLPIILHIMISDIIQYNETREEADKFLPPNELFELYSVILKKRMKKATKKGIENDDLVFDLLGVMPVPEAIKYSRFFRIRSTFDIIYRYAEKDPLINIGKIIPFLFYEEDFPHVISFALQERKSKTKNFNDNQKKVFNDITNFVFNELEDMRKDQIKDILTDYVRARKKDASANKDENRRYYISSLPEDKYPHICKVIENLTYDDEDNKKYL